MQARVPQPRSRAIVTIWIVALAALALGSTLRAGARLEPQGGRPPATGAAGGAPALPPPQSGTGLILGQVVDGASGEPVAEAVVTVVSRIPIASINPAAPAQGLRLLTGADGRFVVHDLPKANILINVAAAGYANGSSGQSRPGGPSRPVEVDEGERVSDLRIRLWKFAVLTGVVLDESGEPAVGINVQAFKRVVAGGRPSVNQAGVARTDDRGVYRISTLTPGDYLVAVPQTMSTASVATMDAAMQNMASMMPNAQPLTELAMSSTGVGGAIRVGGFLVSSLSGAVPIQTDGRFLTYQTVFYPAATSTTQAAVVTLKSGEERAGLDMQLRVTPTARVSGTVTSPRGPAGNMRVRLLPVDVDDAGGGAGFETANTTTGADGAFTFIGVPPGQYVARFVSQPSGGGRGDPAMAFAEFAAVAGAGPGPALYGFAPVVVGTADVAGVAVTLTPGAKVTGRVEFDGPSPRPTPQQQQTAQVSLRPVGGVTGASPGTGRIGQDGTFQTLGYPAGRYTLTVGAGPGGGFGAAWRVRSASVAGRNVLDDPFDLKDGDVTEVVVTFTDQTTQLGGTVRAATGPAPAATVVLFPSDYRTWLFNGMSPRLTRTQLVPTTGAFNLVNLAPGEYFVAALDDNDVPENQDATFFDALARVATRVTMREGDKATHDLQVVRVRR